MTSIDPPAPQDRRQNPSPWQATRGPRDARSSGSVTGGSPPRARGPHVAGRGPARLSGITPACAGTASSTPHRARSIRDHPRVRGDRSCFHPRYSTMQGSPPRARGPQQVQQRVSGGRGITPACAGTASPTPPSSPTSTDHPRVRGDRVVDAAEAAQDQGSPPRARGPHAGLGAGGGLPGITPACAGTACWPAPTRRRRGDHPRVRGDRTWVFLALTAATGSPPRARGPRGVRGHDERLHRITPACAGTATTPRASRRSPSGSPPRARGPLARTGARRRPRGITPACAGTALSLHRRWST